MATKIRNSNFELLRIIAMLFIVIWHISIHAQRGELASHNYILALTITGVNLFVLISGYFGIKLNWKSLLTLTGTVAFYNLASIICKWQITGTTPLLGEIAGSFPPICNTHWWFIDCYFMLMLLSPIINTALDKATDKQYKYTLGILLFTSCISGFCFKNFINITGYNTFHFITIYVLGNAIKKFHLPSRLSTRQFACTYILSTL
ncbi:MAG: acyltransferase family protein, partial [Bacteroidales bacterium]|nr:acyltransferase family protein [Bacteroidales bacterium]